MLSNTRGVAVIWSAYTTKRTPGVTVEGEGEEMGGEETGWRGGSQGNRRIERG